MQRVWFRKKRVEGLIRAACGRNGGVGVDKRFDGRNRSPGTKGNGLSLERTWKKGGVGGREERVCEGQRSHDRSERTAGLLFNRLGLDVTYFPFPPNPHARLGK